MSQNLKSINSYADRLKLINQKWPTVAPNGKRHAPQEQLYRAIFNNGYKRVFIRAGRKGAKSHSCLYIASRIAGCLPNRATYIIGPQYKQQKEIMWHNGKLPNFAPLEFGAQVKEMDTRVCFPDGGFVKLDGSDNFESYRGTEYDCMILDEFKDHDPRFYEASYPNLLARDGIIIVIGTPPDTKNHYYELEKQAREDSDWFFIHWTSWDNPFLPDGHNWLTKEKSKYIARGDYDVWQREYEAEYCFGGKKRIYPMWSNKFMRSSNVLQEVLRQDKHKLKWFTICDPGNQTVFAVMFAAYNPNTAEIYLLDEIYEKDPNKTSARGIFDRIREKERALYPNAPVGTFRRFYDSAAPYFPINVRAVYPGEHFSPTRKESGNKEKEISLIKDIFLQEKIYVSNKCQNFVLEIEDYIRDDNGQLIDKNDHLMDCLRYLVTGCNYKMREVGEMPASFREVRTRRIRFEDEIQGNVRGSDWTDFVDDYDAH